MKIFVIHYKKLINRKKYLTKLLSNFDYEFIEKYVRENISEYDTKYFKNEKLWKKRVDGIYNNIVINYRDLSDAEICNSLSHFDAYEKIINEKLDYAIILEDDVIGEFNFDENINELVEKLPIDFDCVFFGTSYNMKVLDKLTFESSSIISKDLYKKKLGTSRTADAYIVSNKAAKKLVKNMTELSLPIDYELTYFFRHLNMNIYWKDPGFVLQGSMSGQYSSSIR